MDKQSETHSKSRSLERGSSLYNTPGKKGRIGVCKTKLYDWVREGKFPRPISIGGGRAVAWYSDEVDQWINSRERATVGATQTRGQ
jgi:prophage regulatory protein